MSTHRLVQTMFVTAFFGNNPNVIDRRMYKQIMVYPYNKVLLSNQKEQTVDTCNNKKDDSQSMKVDRQERVHTVHNPIYIKF